MPNIDIKIKPSKISILFILFMVLSSLAMIYYSECNSWIKLIAILLANIYGVYIYYKYGLLLSKNAVIGLRQLSSDQWQIIKQNDIVSATLLGESTVTTWVCLLRFKIPDKKWKISSLIFRDSVEVMDNYRKLLVQLRCFRPSVIPAKVRI